MGRWQAPRWTKVEEPVDSVINSGTAVASTAPIAASPTSVKVTRLLPGIS